MGIENIIKKTAIGIVLAGSVLMSKGCTYMKNVSKENVSHGAPFWYSIPKDKSGYFVSNVEGKFIFHSDSCKGYLTGTQILFSDAVDLCEIKYKVYNEKGHTSLIQSYEDILKLNMPIKKIRKYLNFLENNFDLTEYSPKNNNEIKNRYLTIVKESEIHKKEKQNKVVDLISKMNEYNKKFNQNTFQNIIDIENINKENVVKKIEDFYRICSRNISPEYIKKILNTRNFKKEYVFNKLEDVFINHKLENPLMYQDNK